ncbi:MAG TPA: hypothetical protein VGL58_08460 [Caulobacteraceae bacterium]
MAVDPAAADEQRSLSPWEDEMGSAWHFVVEFGRSQPETGDRLPDKFSVVATLDDDATTNAHAWTLSSSIAVGLSRRGVPDR